MLNIKNLQAKIEDKKILKGVNLSVPPGEMHVIMGPNGSGKSTLAQCIFSHPTYEITGGTIEFDGHDITTESPDKIAQLGLLMAFQYPQSVPGVSVTNLLKIATSNQLGEKIPLKVFGEKIEKQARKMQLPDEFLTRSLNDGFSGGEKKKAEVLQLSLLNPKFAIFDETDSGLDVDALKIIAGEINELHAGGSGILLITHYQRILSYLKPDAVHVMYQGKIIRSGQQALAEMIEKEGYQDLIK